MREHVDVDHENMLVSLHEPEGFGEFVLTSFKSSLSVYKHWCAQVDFGPKEQACQPLQTLVFS